MGIKQISYDYPEQEVIRCKFCADEWLPILVSQSKGKILDGTHYFVCANIRCAKDWEEKYLPINEAIKTWNEANTK